MGHGKETPRQKMIGMMYLVLTALLALNVSAEVLNAFLLVDESLRKSTVNIFNKSKDVYGSFEIALSENEAKVRPWKIEADTLAARTQRLIDFMELLKDTIVITADRSRMYVDSGRDVNNIKTKDDNNVPGQIMILEGNGLILKKMLNDYDSVLMDMIQRGSVRAYGKFDSVKVAPLVNGIHAALSTADIQGTDGPKPWENANFEHLPLAGVLTMISKLQTDVRNTEADMLKWLFGQINAGAWTFNKLEAIVVANSNYVLQNNEYKAQVFIAASDSTQEPVIEVNGNKIPIQNGKGIYKGPTGSVGFNKWGGVIKMESPASGEMLEFPFKSEYQVGAPSVVVSPTMMNVFYIGVDNPVEVSASGVPQDQVTSAISAGTMASIGGGKYNVRVSQQGTVYISVTANVDGSSISMGRKEFRVKKLPDPIATIGGQTGTFVMAKTALAAQAGVIAAMPADFDFQAKFNVTQFKVSYTDLQGYTIDKIITGAAFTGEVRQLINNLRPGQKVFFEEIKAVGPDNVPRTLSPIIIRVQ